MDVMKLRRRKLIFVLVLLLLVVVFGLFPLYSPNRYYVYLLTLAFVSIMYTVSLRLSLMLGLFNVGHTAFIATGGYSAVILAIHAGIPTAVSLLVGGLIAAVLGFIISIITVRLQGVYFALTTVALVEVVRIALQRGGTLTGGFNGLREIPDLVIFGTTINGHADRFYWFALVMTLVIIVIIYRLELSRIGLTWKAIQQSRDLSASLGVDVKYYRILAVVIGCFFAGVAGAFFAYFQSYLLPGNYGFLQSVNILILNYIGGLGSIAGPIVGAIFMTTISEPLKGLTYYEPIIYAVILMVVIIILPGGIITLPQRFILWINKLGIRNKAKYYDYNTKD